MFSFRLRIAVEGHVLYLKYQIRKPGQKKILILLQAKSIYSLMYAFGFCHSSLAIVDYDMDCSMYVCTVPMCISI